MLTLNRRTFLRNISYGGTAGALYAAGSFLPDIAFPSENNENVKSSPAKIGVVFFAAKWFEEVVLGNSDTAKDFNKFMKEDTGKILGRLSTDFKVIETPVVTSMDKARSASQKFLSEDVDMVLFVFSVWSEDEYLLPFRDIMEIRPSVVWINTPYDKPPAKSDVMAIFRNSGIVGTFEGFGVLNKMGAGVIFIEGSSLNDAPYTSIGHVARAAKLKKDLRLSKLGILPYRNNQMIVTYVDEFRLYSQIGPSMDYVSVRQLKNAADSIPDSEIRGYVAEVKKNFRLDNRIDDKNLYESSKGALGLQKIIFDRGFDGLALGDLNEELLEVMRLRPVLYPEKLARSDKVLGIEGDIGCTTGMLLLKKLAGTPPMFTEIFNYDRQDNTIVAGHAGPCNYLLADSRTPITITPDYELMDSPSKLTGVWMEFIASPGRVTILNFLCTNDSFQLTILGGESLGGNLRITGYPHYYIKIDPNIQDFLYTIAANGSSHHWAVVKGDVTNELSYLADMLGIKKVMF